jgi:hypothetical protein
MARQPMITIVTGMPGVGKSVETEKQLNLYIQQDASLGRPGRKVLILDTNDEYRKYRSVRYNVRDPLDNGKFFERLVNNEIRRVVPYYPGHNGGAESMTFDDKEKALIDITKNYRNGCVLFEDINTYMIGFKSAETISTLCAARHRGVDIIIQVQSLAAVDTRMFQNGTWIRFHHQADDITRYKDRLQENFEPMKIVQNIVSTEYFAGNKYFFLYFNLRSKKIVGASEEQYKRGLEMLKKQLKGRLGPMLEDNQMMYF